MTEVLRGIERAIRGMAEKITRERRVFSTADIAAGREVVRSILDKKGLGSGDLIRVYRELRYLPEKEHSELLKKLDSKVMACTSGDMEISAELIHELNKKVTTFLDWVSKKPNSP